MKLVYIIEKSRGQWDDYESHNVCVVDTESKAEDICGLLVELQVFNKAFVQTIFEKFEAGYDAAAPRLVAPVRPTACDRFKELQLLLARVDVSPERREQLKAEFKPFQRAHNNNIQEFQRAYSVYSEQSNAQYRLRQAAKEEWVTANYNPPEHLACIKSLLGVYDCDWNFSVSSIKMFE